MSTRTLLQWLNDRLDTNMTKITEMSQGWQYCQLLDMMFAKAVPLTRIHFNPRSEEQKLSNFKLLLTFLERQNAAFPSGSIDIQKLAKGQQTHNLSFLSWFKRWCDDQLGDEELPEYNASERRNQVSSGAIKSTPVRPPRLGTPKKGVVTPRKRWRDEIQSPTARRLVLGEEKDSPDAGETEELGPAMSFFLSQAKKQKKRRPLADSSNLVPSVIITEKDATTPEPVNPAAHQKLKLDLKRATDEAKRKQSDDNKLVRAHKELEQRLVKTQDDLKISEDRFSTAEKLVASLRDEKREKEAELKTWKEKVAALQKDVELATEQLREKDTHISRAETVRKMLHNSLQELKGNIRVFARLRPALPSEDVKEGMFTFPDDLDSRKIEIAEPASVSAITGTTKSRTLTFEFDRVFDPKATQVHIFGEVSQLVQSVLDGYKVCIFAYGQTGSGKTFTMEGSQADLGLIPRAVKLLFERSQDMIQSGWSITLKARYVEIYNDRLRDLLADREEGDEGKKIEVHHSKTDDETYLTNCSLVDVPDSESVHEILKKAKSRRTVAATKMNESSSRSHSVFTLKVSGKNPHTHQYMSSEINLIDLAGSERVKNSGVTGEALKEAEHINTSLTHLGNVIQQLHAMKSGYGKQKMTHIFRNSTLTWLLKSCLGGDCKTLMFVNISPAIAFLPETTNSLRFATKVNNCQIGTASRRVK